MSSPEGRTDGWQIDCKMQNDPEKLFVSPRKDITGVPS